MVVSTTVSDSRAARTLARRLVSERLAACVQHFPIRSVYRWKGKIENAGEHLLLVKTNAARAPELVRRIRHLHSYELPEILVVPATGGLAAYLAWIAAETSVRGGHTRRGRCGRGT